MTHLKQVDKPEVKYDQPTFIYAYVAIGKNKQFSSLEKRRFRKFIWKLIMQNK